jgi:hypothetical protein
MAAFIKLGCITGFNALQFGTSDFVVASAYTDCIVPEDASVIDGKVYEYYAQTLNGGQWESGSGAYDVATHTLSRTTITASSNDDGISIVDFITTPMVYVFPAAFIKGLEISTAHLQSERGTGVAATGEFGETYVSNFTTSMTTTNVAKLLGSIPVPSGGDWEVSGVCQWSGAGTTASTDYYTVISNIATPSINSNSIDGIFRHTRLPSANDYALTIGFTPYTFSTATATMLYMYGMSTFSGPAPVGVGYIRIKRER